MAISVGNDSFTYEVAEGWGELPEGYEWGQIGAVSVDGQDRVHLFTRTDHPLMIFDRDGHFEKSTGEGIIKDAHGLCLDAEGNRFMVDRAAQVAMKFTADGQKLFELGNRDQPSDTGYTEENRTVLRAAGPFHHPTDVALSASGDFYVSDGYRNARVHKFSADGTFLFSWGEPGTGPGQFRLVHSVWEARGRVYVADRENNRIQVFTPQGEYLEMWTDFLQPCDIYVDDNEIMYVAELQGRVTLLSLDGTVLTRIGNPEQRTAEPGKFVGPHGIWADQHGDFYVSEVLTGQRVQKFIRK
jgi:DNA-binding beta-propeller fold protein YncE